MIYVYNIKKKLKKKSDLCYNFQIYEKLDL